MYDGMGNTGGSVPASTSYPSGAGVSVAGQVIERSGYTFLGWNTAADGTGSIYQQGSSVVMNSDVTLYAQWAPGTILKDCGSFTGQLTIPNIYLSSSRAVYRDTTNNTITITIPTFYSNSAGGPYGTGNGPTDTPPIPNPFSLPSHSGNLKSSYATATISQISGVYQINTTYTNAYTGGTYTQTSTLPFTSTYWPTGETIASVTYYTNNAIASFIFDQTSTGTPSQPGTNVNASPCYGFGGYDGPTTTTKVFSVVAFYIIFSNGTTTRVAVGTQQSWTGTTNPYTYVFNYTRAELANGPTPSPITGPFTPSSSTGVNTPNV
jgi:uncharacterized repeat protein (TIGR02543 family)